MPDYVNDFTGHVPKTGAGVVVQMFGIVAKRGQVFAP